MRIAAVIPAYNEAKTIEAVVEVVRNHHLIDETIVVSDGSTDNTANRAAKSGAKVIELTINQGKGAAMQAGVDSTEADIILFLDADLLGLKEEHITSLLEPVIEAKVKTTIGLFSDGRMATDLAQKIAPFLSGQRAVKRSLLNDISDLDMTRFGVEVALTRYLKDKGIQVEEVKLEDMSHVMKEEKLGMIKGFQARLKMYWEILKNISIKRRIR